VSTVAGTGVTLADDLRRVGFLDGRDAGAEDADRGWFEKDLVVTRPDLLDRCVDHLAPLLPDDVDRLAATGPASTALAVALALRTRIPVVLGDGGRFVGDAYPGARVTLVADVLLSGRTVADDVAALRAGGFVVAGVVALLDRGRGALAALGADGVPARAGFTEHELLRS
jgi:orotate phosphoribosyltransferase